jgi:hypothetical protein
MVFALLLHVNTGISGALLAHITSQNIIVTLPQGARQSLCHMALPGVHCLLRAAL